MFVPVTLSTPGMAPVSLTVLAMVIAGLIRNTTAVSVLVTGGPNGGVPEVEARLVKLPEITRFAVTVTA